MKGDFSALPYRQQDNDTGVWHQQGRVLLDQDWNANTLIQRHLREILGQDVIGPDVIGIPAAERDSWAITSASSDGSTVDITLNPGRGWIDGLHLYLPGTAPVTLPATWLGPPHAPALPDASTIAAGIRDAVVLEAWEESISAYQDPVDLLEPALGGPDTTLRSRLHWRLRLLRLEADEDCGNLDRLQDDPATRGRLTVTPAPTTAIAGDCPVEASGGYEGFEHYFYRLEVASPDTAGDARIKFSRFNGGLVGRGTFDAVLEQIQVLANDQMIDHCGLDNFFIEVLAPHASGTYWETVMEADASLAGNGLLALSSIRGAWPGAAADEAFFRLWDGVRPIAEFTTGSPVELDLGIELEFDAPAADNSNYRPGDWWTFPARAAGTDFDPSVWPSDAAPQGVIYHRAPLGVLNWTGSPAVTLTGTPAIHDCRHVFQPLTRQQTCCRYRVGDGITSHGDFDSIQEAINHLPESGGEICVLPGTYNENIEIDKDHVHIHGCGRESRVIGIPVGPDDTGYPAVFHARGHNDISISSLFIQAAEGGAGIVIEGVVNEETGAAAYVQMFAFEDLTGVAGAECVLRLTHVAHAGIRRCRFAGLDVPGPWSPVYLLGDDMVVEHNDIRVLPRGPQNGVTMIDNASFASLSFGSGGGLASAGRGGIHLAGASERISLIDNHIQGGIGHGIVLGSVNTIERDGTTSYQPGGWIVNAYDPCDPCSGGGVLVNPGDDPNNPGVTYESAGALRDIRIERNTIHDMGLAGIGVVAFFNLDESDEFISVFGLDILGNSIHHNLWRELAAVDQESLPYMGYGAICLADAEALRIHDNVIEDNGPDHLQPVCGIFVLHVEGADVCRNRIANNGRQTDEPADEAVAGRRAGIYIVHALPGIDAIEYGREFRPRQNGVPAVRIHDNIVTQPLGQALALGGIGGMSIQGNQLTSQAFVQRFTETSAFATTVYILNLGISNEFYFQTILFRGPTSDPIDPGDMPDTSSDFIPTPRRGLDDQGIGRYLANGNVMFNDNQVFLDLSEPEVSFAISQALIISLDDVAVQNNQFECDFLVDILFTNLLTIGMTTRVQDNRFKETLMIALFSSVNLGLIFNNTSNNQATHCMLNIVSPLDVLPFLNTSIREQGNQVLFNALNFLDFWCEALGTWRNIFVQEQGASAGNGTSATTGSVLTLFD